MDRTEVVTITNMCMVYDDDKGLVQEKIIDGIETYYSKFTESESEFIRNYCTKNNLYMSAGTDCHGDKKPDRKVGIGYGNMNVPISVVEDWINN